ncbi:hypothetical protein [Mycolicibacterium septicum]|uniref:hypothetical protein n=1 Tax=Mycolicibacterium septicum TaxID=98668 RepID=UPI001AF4E49B|nr:hypothetical protein [Mycolicibacterium septicum]QRY51748.1 hypothetical protein JVX95_30980 [Mycolicibacterium septicum]
MTNVGDLFIMIHPTGDRVLMKIAELQGGEFRAEPATQDDADKIGRHTSLPELDTTR